MASDKIVYIPNGVHLGNFKEVTSRSEARKEFGLPSLQSSTQVRMDLPMPSIPFCARQIFNNRNDVEFVLVGDGPSKSALVEEAAT